MQRSLTLTPTATPSLSCSPSESPPALRENRRYSPALAGSELTAPFCLANCLAALRTERQPSLALTPPASPTLGDLRIFPGFSRQGTYRSILPGESPSVLRAGWQRSLTLSPMATAAGFRCCSLLLGCVLSVFRLSIFCLSFRCLSCTACLRS